MNQIQSSCAPVPSDVAEAAAQSLKWRKEGRAGGTVTGWRRARQLTHQKCVSLKTLKIMRAWFARHGPDAKNGGTSYQGYKAYRRGGPISRGAVAWQLWGGDAAYRWLKTREVRKMLSAAFPDSRVASGANNLASYMRT